MNTEDVELRKQLWEQNQMIIELQKKILEYQIAMQNLMNQHDYFKD